MARCYAANVEVSQELVMTIVVSAVTAVAGMLGLGKAAHMRKTANEAEVAAARAPLPTLPGPGPQPQPQQPPAPPAWVAPLIESATFRGKTSERLDRLEDGHENIHRERIGSDAAVAILARDLSELQTRDKLRKEVRSEILREMAEEKANGAGT